MLRQPIDNSDNSFEPLTDDMLKESLAYREDPARDVTVDPGPALEQADTEMDWRDFITPKGYNLIVRWKPVGKDITKG